MNLSVENQSIVPTVEFTDEEVGKLTSVKLFGLDGAKELAKKHYLDLDEIDSATLIHVMEIAKKLRRVLEEKLNCIGISLLQNNGSIQEVKHYHLHLKPYYKGKKSIEMIKHSEFISDVNEIYKKIDE